jgi:PAS domain S-box-containing protein
MLISSMMLAIFFGIGPDSREATMQGRAALCESIALNSSILVGRGDFVSMEGIIKALVERNRSILSAGIRRSDGTMHLEIGPHQEHWVNRTGYSTDSQVQVPLRNGDKPWGTVELCFEPLQEQTLRGYASHPWLKFILLVATASFFSFYFYLGRVLKQLDPSNAIPKRVRAALDTLAEGLLVTDKRGRVVLANEAFAKWIGKDPDKMIGQEASKFAWQAKDDDTNVGPFPWSKAIEEAVAQPQVYLKLVDKDHRVLTLVANSSPVLGQDGKYRGVLTSFEDITELQQNRVELSEARDLADAANQAKSDFLARMSHEIRTPMNAILGFTEILQRGMARDEDQRREYLQTIQSSGEHLLTLINDILDLSKIESGKMDLELARYQPMEIISQALSIFQLKAQEKGLKLSFQAETWLPETILTDTVRLRQIIINLVGNAIKFTERGGVLVVARMTDGARPMLAFDIVDTGIGISEQAITKIFDPFSQEDTSITRRFGGTGLGLSICRFLAELMGGGVTASSVQGKGSVFTITIDPGPLEGIARIEPHVLAKRTKASAENQLVEIRLPKCHILVVDDGAANRQLVTVYLERAGAQVSCATNGQEALARVTSNRYDLVLMDVHMPVMDGMEATRRMRAQGLQIPIIALTGNVMKDDEDSCRAAGYSGFLAKPIRMQTLLSTIAEQLNQRPGEVLALPSTACQPEPDEMSLLQTAKNTVQEINTIIHDAKVITSDLPTDDDEIRTIVQEFVVHLRERVTLIEQVHQRGDYRELEDLAHWLKGAGGSLGFRQFTIPARDLEAACRVQDTAAIQANVEEIRRIMDRVRSPNELVSP